MMVAAVDVVVDVDSAGDALQDGEVQLGTLPHCVVTALYASGQQF